MSEIDGKGKEEKDKVTAPLSPRAGIKAPRREKATACIVIGMAGSGKTTLMQRINAHLHTCGCPGYMMNLDPAVTDVPYGTHIDIRDTVDYKQVMSQYELGPNGAIMTSLNLFCTRFDQVADLVEKRLSSVDYVMVDTPGQIEVFNWSASGTIVTETLASLTPTVVIYVVDAARCTNPVTFMSNMLYSCGVAYRTRLPMVVALNKCDAADAEVLREWMDDLDAFQDALDAHARESGSGGVDGSGGGYIATLSRSMALVLSEFYSCLSAVPVSAVTGEGVHEMFDAVAAAAERFDAEYGPVVERARAERLERERERRDGEMEKLERDLEKAGLGSRRRVDQPEVSSATPIDDQELSDTDVPDVKPEDGGA